MHEEIQALFNKFIDVSLARSRHHKQLKFSYTIDPKEDLGMERVTPQRSDAMQKYADSRNIVIEYNLVTRSFHVQIDLAAVILNVKQVYTLTELHTDIDQ